MSLKSRFYFRELLKRRKDLRGKTDLPKKPFFSSRGQRAPFFASQKLKRIFAGIIALAVIIGAMYFFLFSEAVRIKEVLFFHGKEKVSELPFDFPAADFIGKHMFFLGSFDMRKDILISHQNEISSLAFHRKIPSALIIRYDTFQDAANVSIRLEGIERTFLVNKFGVVTKVDEASSGLPLITGNFEKFPFRREIIIDKNNLRSITRAHEIFTKKFGMKSPFILYKKIEREAHLRTERDFWIFLDLTQEIERQLFKLKRALPKLDIYQERLEYIDLRISGKTGERVIFKRR